MKNFIKNNKIILTVILVAIIIALGFIVRTGIKESAKANLIFQNDLKERTAKNYYELCKLDAFENYDTNWKGECKTRGLKTDCSLPQYNADSLNESWETDKKECMELYKLELDNI